MKKRIAIILITVTMPAFAGLTDWLSDQWNTLKGKASSPAIAETWQNVKNKVASNQESPAAALERLKAEEAGAAYNLVQVKNRGATPAEVEQAQAALARKTNAREAQQAQIAYKGGSVPVPRSAGVIEFQAQLDALNKELDDLNTSRAGLSDAMWQKKYGKSFNKSAAQLAQLKKQWQAMSSNNPQRTMLAQQISVKEQEEVKMLLNKGNLTQAEQNMVNNYRDLINYRKSLVQRELSDSVVGIKNMPKATPSKAPIRPKYSPPQVNIAKPISVKPVQAPAKPVFSVPSVPG